VQLAQLTRQGRYGARPAAREDHFTRADLFLPPRRTRGRHHFAAIVVIAALVFVGFRLFPQRDVTVLDNGQAVRVSTTFSTSAGLGAAGVSLGPGDQVRFASEGRYHSVAVDRATPVEVEVDGQVIALRTQASTLEGALAEAHVQLRDGDRVLVAGKPVAVRGPLAAFEAGGSPRGLAAARALPGASSDTPLAVQVVRARPVLVYIDTLRVEANSAAATVQEMLAELGITIREEDLVRPGLDSPVVAGMAVRLARAKSVSVVIDGREHLFYTQAATVGDIIRLMGADPGADGILSLPREAPVTTGMRLIIGLVRTVREEVLEAIQPPIVYETDSSLAPGVVKVVPGVDGKRSRTFVVTYRNGEEVSRVEEGSAKVVEPAVPTRHITGTKPPPSSGGVVDAPDYRGPYSRTLVVKATWYNATHGGKPRDHPAYGITATGIPLDYGICAVDPAVIPLGTWMYIPYYGRCLAADTGGGVRGNIVDLGFPESAGDSPWRTQVLEIYILD
jgi:uncharacterized protein YabE (DUF348 family)/3D (Asp-Asp-Asp) domain-containing protein